MQKCNPLLISAPVKNVYVWSNYQLSRYRLIQGRTFNYALYISFYLYSYIKPDDKNLQQNILTGIPL